MKYRNPKFVYLTASAVVGFIFSIVFTVSQIYRVQTVGLNPLQLVLVGTVLEVTAFIFEIPTGVVADMVSRRLSVIIGTFLFGLGFIVEGLFPIFGMVLAAQVIWGLGWTFISGAHEAWITDEVGTHAAGALFLRGTQVNRIGSLVGIPVVLWLANINYQIPIILGGVLFLGLGVFRVGLMPETGFSPTPAEERQTWRAMWNTFAAGLQLTRLQPALWAYIGIAVFVGLYSEGYDRLSDKHWIDNFQFPAFPWGGDPIVGWFALIRLIGIPLDIAVTEVVRRRENWLRSKNAIWLLQFLYTGMIGGMLVLAWTKQFYIAFGAILLIDALRGTTFPVTTAWVNQFIDSKVRATVLSMISQVDALGQMAGGPLVGAIGNLRSVRAAISTSALLLTPTLVLFGNTRKKIATPQFEQE